MHQSIESNAFRTCVLIVEPDADVAMGLATVLSSTASSGESPRELEDLIGAMPRCATPGRLGRCRMVGSLRELHDCPLDELELVLCAAALPDGSALDAMAYLQGIRRDLPVIVHGSVCDNVLAAEVIRAGALDYVVTGGNIAGLTLAVEKCRAHQRIKEENQRLHRELSRFVGELADKNLQL